MARIARSIIVCLLLLPVFSSAEDRYDVDHVKAILIINFITFTRWPSALPPPDNFLICISEEKPYSNIFKNFPDIRIRNKPVKVEHLKQNAKNHDIQRCHVLLIRLTDAHMLAELLAKTEKLSVLTISDFEEAENHHSMIKLILNGDRVTFSINMRSSNKAGIKFNSGMLRLAERIFGKNG